MTCIATWSLPYALHGSSGWEEGTLDCDIARFGRVINHKTEKLPSNIVVNATWKDVKKIYKEGLKSQPIGCDIETMPGAGMGDWTGKDPTRARLRSVGFGTDDWGLSFMWHTADEKLKFWTGKLLASKRVLKIFHNGHFFDCPILRRYGFKIRHWKDTRDMRRAQVSTSRLSLRFLGSLMTDLPAWKEFGDEDEGTGVVATKNTDGLQHYNAMDCVATARIYKVMKREPEEKWPLTQRLYAMHSKLSNLAARMYKRGVYVHKQARAFMDQCLRQELAEKEAAFCDFAKVTKCTDWTLRALLFRMHKKDGIPNMGIPDPVNPKMYTTEEQLVVSVDENNLLFMLACGDIPQSALPLLDRFWDAKTVKTQLSFIKSTLVDQAIGDDGRLRAGWNSCGTDTGRFSCSEPNIMNIQQGLRAYLGAPPGWTLVHGDMSMLELRVMEVVSNDTFLFNGIKTGDPYSGDAKAYFGLPADMDVKKLKPKARTAAKIIRLACQYNAGLTAVYTQVLKQDRTAQFHDVKMLFNQFRSTNKGIVAYWEEEHARVEKLGYSESRLMGRRRYYPQMPPPTETANYPIQSTAADMMNQMTIALDRRLAKEVPDAAIIIQLHDALDIECREKDAEKVRRIMNEEMSKEWEICGRKRMFPVEIKQSADWSEV